MRLLTTVTRLSSGQLSILGLDPVRQAKQIKRRLGVVPQSNNLDEDLTVLQNLRIYSRYFGASRRESEQAAGEALTFAHLNGKANDYVNTLSGGMKRRLTIARALVNDPDLLLMDEPTAALDAQSKQHIWSAVGALRTQGKTILLMSHDMEEVQVLCDEVHIMESGRFVAHGAPHELIRAHCRPARLEIVIDRPATVDWATVLRDPAVQVRPTARGVAIEVDDPEASLRLLRASALDYTAASARPSDLTDVYLQITGREAD
jgi:lipooligosaccharide transport system ATP-binding protein